MDSPYLVNQRPLWAASLFYGLIALGVGLVLTQISPWLSLAIVGGMAVVLLVLRYPIFGLGLALLAGPFGALENLFLGYSVIDSGQLFLLLTLSIWLARGLYQRQIIIPSAALQPHLLLFIWIALLSTLDAPSASVAVRELIKWIEIWLIILFLLSEMAQFNGRHITFLKIVVGLFLLSGFVQALIGIWQFGLRGIGPEHFLISGNFYRAYGSFEQPNPFGGMMHIITLLAVGIAAGMVPKLSAWARQIFIQRKWRFPPISLFDLWVLICAAAALLALLFSWSRGAWLGFAAGVVALAFYWPRQRWLGVLLLVMMAGFLVITLQSNVLPANISTRLLGFAADFQLGDVRGVDINDANYSVLERLAHWQTAVEMAKDHIWLGVGFGNYEAAYATYALINWPDALGHAHNYYLNLLAEIGVIGLTAYLLFWIIVIHQTLQQINTQSGLKRGIVLGLLGCWVAISAHHLVDKLYVNNLYIQVGVLVGLLQLVRNIRENQTI